MCLSYLGDYRHINLDKGVGWKFFKINEKGKLKTPYLLFEFPINRWVKDKAVKKIKFGLRRDQTYPAGFHIYLTKKDADDMSFCRGTIVKKVKYRNVVAKGYQGKHKVIVAREMLVIPNKKGDKK